MLEMERYQDVYETASGSYVDQGFHVTTWIMQTPTKQLSWKDKFRWIKQILVHGSLWSDGVVLTDEAADNLANYIKDHLKEAVTKPDLK